MHYKDFPQPRRLLQMLGPSFLVIATGIGSGEIILWPLIASDYWLWLVRVALIGITCQFFINMEIERYTLATWETVFWWLHRLRKYAPQRFVFSTFLSFAFPGTVAASAQIFWSLLGIENYSYLAILGLLIAWFTLSIWSKVYDTFETLAKILLSILVVWLVIFVWHIAWYDEFLALGQWFIWQWDWYTRIPEWISLASLSWAFAYAWTWWNLNLTQSNYVDEEGYGMGKYTPKLSWLFTDKTNDKKNAWPHSFELNKKNLHRFNTRRKRMNIEHFFVFRCIWLLTIALLMMIAYIASPENANHTEWVYFIIQQAKYIGETYHSIIGTLFMVVVGVLLLQSQIWIYDGWVRIMTKNIEKLSLGQKYSSWKIYYSLLRSRIIAWIIIFLLGITNPVVLVTISASISALSMFVHIWLVNFMNHSQLPQKLQPNIFRKWIMIIIFLLFLFSVTILIYDSLHSLIW